MTPDCLYSPLDSGLVFGVGLFPPTFPWILDSPEIISKSGEKVDQYLGGQAFYKDRAWQSNKINNTNKINRIITD